MVPIDLSGKTALITGGTQGIGRAAALSLAQAGVQVFLTCKWGSADESELMAEFEHQSGTKPQVFEADVSVDEDTALLFQKLRDQTDHLDIFISNVGFAPQIKTLDDYTKRGLFKTIEYSSWPIIAYTQKTKEIFSSYPRRIIGISSDGPDHYYLGYDYVSAAKALLEHFARYLSVHLLPGGSRVNIIRFGTVKTASFDAIFGESFFEFLRSEGLPESLILEPAECGTSVLALCSGLLDAVNGQVLTVDYGLPYQDNLMMRYLKKKESDAQGATI